MSTDKAKEVPHAVLKDDAACLLDNRPDGGYGRGKQQEAKSGGEVPSAALFRYQREECEKDLFGHVQRRRQ